MGPVAVNGALNRRYLGRLSICFFCHRLAPSSQLLADGDSLVHQAVFYSVSRPGNGYVLTDREVLTCAYLIRSSVGSEACGIGDVGRRASLARAEGLPHNFEDHPAVLLEASEHSRKDCVYLNTGDRGW